MIVFSFLMLLAEASRVVEARVELLAQGKASPDEIFLMVSEKFEAMHHASWVLARGGDPALVIDNYRKIVAANAERFAGRSAS